MGQVIQVNGDYNIKSKTGGTITLDTGASGETRVTGNLVVEGETLTVSTQELQIKDNIILLNEGEPNAGVTLRYSGVQIDRGTADDVLFAWDENSGTWNFITIDNGGLTPTGTYDFNVNASIRVRQITTDSGAPDGGDLNLIGYGGGVVNVAGTTNYLSSVIAFGDDAIPNKAYVDYAIQSSPARQIKDDDTKILIADIDAIGSGGGLDYLGNPVPETDIEVIVDGIPNTIFYSNRVLLQGLEISDTEIANNDTSSNIYLRTTGTGKVQTNYSIQLEQLGSNPADVPGYSQIYARAPDTGDTGLFFRADRSGELISKNRALLYSMLF